MTTPFKPEARTAVKSVRHINYTCGPKRYAQLQVIAKTANISMKELLRQMVEHALENMEQPQ